MKVLKLSYIPLSMLAVLLILAYLIGAFAQWDFNAGNWPQEFRENMTMWAILSIIVSLVVGGAVIGGMLEED